MSSLSNHQQQPFIVAKSPKNNCLKSFVNRHSNLVDFLSSSIVICLCFTVLLPRVHESFAPKTIHSHEPTVEEATGEHTIGSENVTPNELDDAQTTATSHGGPIIEDEVHNHGHHHHNHTFPTGEVLICVGFFVFYCIGLKLNRPVGSMEEQFLVAKKRSVSATVCCSSTRCPSSQPIAGPSTTTNEGNQRRQQQLLDTNSIEKQLVTRRQSTSENECLLLLNRHHQHHTHNRHHEHTTTAPTNYQSEATNQRVSFVDDDGRRKLAASKRSDYGTASSNNSDNDELRREIPNQETTIVVDEIRITSPPPMIQGSRNFKNQCWPHSIKMLFVSLILAASLIMFDMNILGLLRTLRVFRAASTGALLYIAFFIMLPRQSAGCNSCQDEEN